MPPWALDPPPLEGEDGWYLKAFRRLSTTRQIGMDAGRIPWHHIVAYAERAGFDHASTDAFVSIIEEMDIAYLDWMQEQRDNGKK